MRFLGLGGFEWLIILVIVILVFGVGRISKISKELGQSIRGFKEGLKGEEESNPDESKTDKSKTD